MKAHTPFSFFLNMKQFEKNETDGMFFKIKVSI